MRIVLLATSILLSVALPALHAQERAVLATPPNGDNQRAEVSQWIGLVKLTIAYHSPRVHFQGRERTGHIWGELIPFGLYDEGFGPSRATPWRAGANESTLLTISHNVKIEGKDVAAGTYALFLELAQSGPWHLILSSNPGWGAFQYEPSEVMLRVPVTPVEAPFTEFLTYGFEDRLPASATAFLQWENKHVPFRIDVPNVNELYVAQMRQDLRGWAAFDHRNWQMAAQFAVANKIALDEALVWANRAISEPFRNAAAGREDFSTLGTKADVLDALGRHAEADSAMDRAMRLSDLPLQPTHQYAVRLLRDGRKDRAMTVFRLNRQRHPQDLFLTYVGLARGSTALGDTTAAIANWRRALKNVPPAQEANRRLIEQALSALEKQKSRGQSH